MRLAAVYLDYHDYLFTKPQTINLGGRYLYSFTKKDKIVTISKTLNKNFIDGFFDTTHLESKLLNITAIVGQNGAGKSSIFDSIRSLFIENPYALPSNNTYLFFETENEKELKFASSIYVVGNGTVTFKSDSIKIDAHRTNSNYQTIYYSPHFDFKYNPNFDSIDSFDISFDKIVEEDLEDLFNKKPNTTGSYSASQELLFKNSIRHILFLSSDLVMKSQIFKELFDFPNLGEARLEISSYKSEK